MDYDRANQEIWTIVFKRYRNATSLPVTVKEITQYVLIKFWKQQEKGEPVEYLKSWTEVVAANFVITEIRAHDRNPEENVDIEDALLRGDSDEDLTCRQKRNNKGIRRWTIDQYEEESRKNEGPDQDEEPSLDLVDLVPSVWKVTRTERLYFLLRYLPIYWRVEELGEFKRIALEELAHRTGLPIESLIPLCEARVDECIRQRDAEAAKAGKLSTEAIQSIFPANHRPTVSSINKAFSLAMTHMKLEVVRDKK